MVAVTKKSTFRIYYITSYIASYTVYGKTFEGENFRGYTKKHVSLEKFRGLACKCYLFIRIMNRRH